MDEATRARLHALTMQARGQLGDHGLWQLIQYVAWRINRSDVMELPPGTRDTNRAEHVGAAAPGAEPGAQQRGSLSVEGGNTQVLAALVERLGLAEALAPGAEEALGWIYQYWQEPLKDAIFARLHRQGGKLAPGEIAPATQIFTPRWIVDYLVQNTLGRLWLQMHPDSTLAERWGCLIPIEAPPLPARAASSITVLDPACGTMHIGLAAFDLLAAMYDEEQRRAGEPGWPVAPPARSGQEIAESILRHNLYGVDVDGTALEVAALALALKAGTSQPPAQLARGDLLRRELAPLARERFDVVVTNPPYLGKRSMEPELARRLKADYPQSTGDLYAAFLERCAELVAPDGRQGLIVQQSFMFISSYEPLRRALLAAHVVETMCHAGAYAFDEVDGEKVNTTAFVMRRTPTTEEITTESTEDAILARRARSESTRDTADTARAHNARDRQIERYNLDGPPDSPPRPEPAPGVYIRLVDQPDAEAKRATLGEAAAALRRDDEHPAVYRCRQAEFEALEGAPWVYWLPPQLRQLFQTLPRLGALAELRQGLATGDNARFVRYWWEVGAERIAFGCADEHEARASGKRWFPYMKGGGFCRWWGNQDYVVNWQRDGAEIRRLGAERGRPRSRPQNTACYFRPGVTYSYLTSSTLSARLSPGGYIFDVAGSSLFLDDLPLALAVLNSSFASYALRIINPTVNVQVGDLARLPIPRSSSPLLHQLVARALELARERDASDETTLGFIAPAPPAAAPSVHERLALVERELDDEVSRLYGLGAAQRKQIDSEVGRLRPAARRAPMAQADALSWRWISYAVGIVLGRFQPGVAAAHGRGRGNLDVGVAAELRALALHAGLGVLGDDHPEALAPRVEHTLSLLLGARAPSLIAEATQGHALDDYLAGAWWAEHIRQYRQRPVYWLLQSPGRGYGLLAHHERLDHAQLARLLGPGYLGGAIGRSRDQRRADLVAFATRIEAALARPNERGDHAGWRREPDDGVLINLAPLAELLPAWAAEPRRCWAALERGDLDWSHTARRYWPARVAARCSADRSLATAHGIE